MLVKVKYTDGSTGMIRPIRLPGLLESGRVVGFQGSDGWVEVRREPTEEDDGSFQGPERRKPE
jgi:hypothetical protein